MDPSTTCPRRSSTGSSRWCRRRATSTSSKSSSPSTSSVEALFTFHFMLASSHVQKRIKTNKKQRKNLTKIVRLSSWKPSCDRENGAWSGFELQREKKDPETCFMLSDRLSISSKTVNLLDGKCGMIVTMKFIFDGCSWFEFFISGLWYNQKRIN